MNNDSEAEVRQKKMEKQANVRSNKIRRFFLAGWAASLLAGLGSCVASVFVPDPNPNASLSTSNGMYMWESVEKKYNYKFMPDWCVRESVLGDGGYSELNCFVPEEIRGSAYIYSVMHCVLDEPDSPTSCNQGNKATFSEYERGKWMRFYGNAKLLEEEKILVNLSGSMTQIGMILFWVASSSFATLWILISITNNKWKL
jgi:hypothetical protein